MELALRFDPPSRYAGDEESGPRRREKAFERVSGADTLSADHPDMATVEALRSGDAAAFESVYLQYAPSTYEFAQRYVDADIANDIVQDVFLALWKRRTTLVISSGIRAYLFGAARLRALQVRRNRDVRAGLNASMASAEPPLVVDPVEQAEVRDAVSHALMTLPGRTRELLALRWVYEMSYADAASVLGVSPEAAKKLGRRAEVALAPLLERFRRP